MPKAAGDTVGFRCHLSLNVDGFDVLDEEGKQMGCFLIKYTMYSAETSTGVYCIFIDNFSIKISIT